MAAAKKAAPAAKKTGGALVKWDEALAAKAKKAQKVASNVGGGGGNFLSFKGGKLAYKDAKIPGDAMDCIVLSAVAENNFFEGRFDPKKPQSPLCYAFGSPDGEDDEMKPHDAVFKAGNNQADMCANCEHNEWGSAEKGRGKACKNVVRLALIPASVLKEKDVEAAIKAAEVAYAKLPVTSGKNWSGYVGTLDDKHFLQFITKLSVVAGEEDYFSVEFEAVEEIDGPAIGALLAKSDKEDANIGFEYPVFEDEPQRPARKTIPIKKGGATAKPAAKPVARKAAKY